MSNWSRFIWFMMGMYAFALILVGVIHAKAGV